MDGPTLRQLRYFLMVAEELHFGRAADRLGIAQPPLTQQMQKLELLIGCQLLVRGRKNQLTQAGLSLAADARRLINQADQTFDNARRIAQGEAGELRIGVPPSVMLTELPGAIRKYRQRYPEVRFTLRELATSTIEESLRAGEIDVGFLRETQPQEPLNFQLYLSEPLVAILPARHRLAAGVTLKKLRSEPFILFPRPLGPAFYDRLIAACVSAGFTPKVAQEATQWQTIISFVEAGMGVSIAPACVTKLRRPGVVYRHLQNYETAVYVAWREGDISPAAKNFLSPHLRALRSN